MFFTVRLSASRIFTRVAIVARTNGANNGIGWESVGDADGNHVPATPEGIDALLDI